MAGDEGPLEKPPYHGTCAAPPYLALPTLLTHALALQVYAAEWHSTSVAVKMLYQAPSTAGSGSLSSGGGGSLSGNLAAAANLLAKLEDEADIMFRWEGKNNTRDAPMGGWAACESMLPGAACSCCLMPAVLTALTHAPPTPPPRCLH